MSKRELSDAEKNELWKDDKFSLSKERASKQADDVKIQNDYATTMGRNFFHG